MFNIYNHINDQAPKIAKELAVNNNSFYNLKIDDSIKQSVFNYLLHCCSLLYVDETNYTRYVTEHLLNEKNFSQALKYINAAFDSDIKELNPLVVLGKSEFENSILIKILQQADTTSVKAEVWIEILNMFIKLKKFQFDFDQDIALINQLKDIISLVFFKLSKDDIIKNKVKLQIIYNHLNETALSRKDIFNKETLLADDGVAQESLPTSRIFLWNLIVKKQLNIKFTNGDYQAVNELVTANQSPRMIQFQNNATSKLMKIRNDLRKRIPIVSLLYIAKQKCIPLELMINIIDIIKNIEIKESKITQQFFFDRGQEDCYFKQYKAEQSFLASVETIANIADSQEKQKAWLTKYDKIINSPRLFIPNSKRYNIFTALLDLTNTEPSKESHLFVDTILKQICKQDNWQKALLQSTVSFNHVGPCPIIDTFVVGINESQVKNKHAIISIKQILQNNISSLKETYNNIKRELPEAHTRLIESILNIIENSNNNSNSNKMR